MPNPIPAKNLKPVNNSTPAKNPVPAKIPDPVKSPIPAKPARQQQATGEPLKGNSAFSGISVGQKSSKTGQPPRENPIGGALRIVVIFNLYESNFKGSPIENPSEGAPGA